jgi:hypothetical protein
MEKSKTTTVFFAGRIDKEVMVKIGVSAEENCRSKAAEIEYALRQYLKQKEGKNDLYMERG